MSPGVLPLCEELVGIEPVFKWVDTPRWIFTIVQACEDGCEDQSSCEGKSQLIHKKIM